MKEDNSDFQRFFKSFERNKFDVFFLNFINRQVRKSFLYNRILLYELCYVIKSVLNYYSKWIYDYEISVFK